MLRMFCFAANTILNETHTISKYRLSILFYCAFCDISIIQSLEIEDEEDEVDKYGPIVLSDTWYEFFVFAEKFSLHPKTAGKWLDNGWLAYLKMGRIRIINKFDIEAMMLHFRKPAIWE